MFENRSGGLNGFFLLLFFSVFFLDWVQTECLELLLLNRESFLWKLSSWKLKAQMMDGNVVYLLLHC